VDDSTATDYPSDPAYEPSSIPSYDSPSTLPIPPLCSDSRNNRRNGSSMLPLPTMLPQKLRCEPDVAGEEAKRRLDRNFFKPHQSPHMQCELRPLQYNLPPLQYDTRPVQYDLPSLRHELPCGRALATVQRQTKALRQREALPQPGIPPASLNSGRGHSRRETAPGTRGVDPPWLAPVQVPSGPTKGKNECNHDHPQQNHQCLLFSSKEERKRDSRHKRREIIRSDVIKELQRRAEEARTESNRKRQEVPRKSLGECILRREEEV
jgi:hypothetical protein